jgi:hypothetical protein
MIASTIVVAIALIWSGYFYYLTMDFPPPLAGQEHIPGPGVYPKLLIQCLWLLCFLLLVRMWRGKEVVSPELRNAWLLVLSAAMMVFCLLLLEPVGFFIVMPCYLVFQIRLLFYTRWKTIITLTAVATVFFYIVFYKTLNVPLPLGILNFTN